MVGLNALSEFAEMAYSDTPSELSVSVTATDLQAKMNVSYTQRNLLLLQTARIPALPDKITVEVKGEGCALVQVNSLK